MKKKKNFQQCCETCANLLCVGEGDHICEEDPTKMPVSGYEPTDEYFWCGGKEWRED